MNNKFLIFDEKSQKWNRSEKYINRIKDMQDKSLREVGIGNGQENN